MGVEGIPAERCAMYLSGHLRTVILLKHMVRVRRQKRKGKKYPTNIQHVNLVGEAFVY